LSISNQEIHATEFDRWVAVEFARSGAFTALVVLVDISAHQVTPLCSTYFNVVGDEIDWHEIIVLFAGSGADWDAACFFPMTAPNGAPLDNPNARSKLRELEARLDRDLRVLKEGHCFSKLGQRLGVEQIGLE
jgi:hypothetical protein